MWCPKHHSHQPLGPLALSPQGYHFPPNHYRGVSWLGLVCVACIPQHTPVMSLLCVALGQAACLGSLLGPALRCGIMGMHHSFRVHCAIGFVSSLGHRECGL